MKLQSRLALSVLHLLLASTLECTAQYTPPVPQIIPLYPKGIRFAIRDEDGISLVAYHAKFNEDFDGLEAGTIARDVVRVSDGRWIYEDYTTSLKPEDKIYLWIRVVYNGLGYNLLDQVFKVKEFHNLDGSVHFTSQTPARSNATEVYPAGGNRADSDA